MSFFIMLISKEKAIELLKMNVYERDEYFRSILQSVVFAEKRSAVKKNVKKNKETSMEELLGYQRRLLLFPTKREKIMKDILDSLDLHYEFQKIMPPYICDFVIKQSNGEDRCVIEIDGTSHEDKCGYDKKRDKYIESYYGLKTYRFTNKEVVNKPEFKENLLKTIGFSRRRNV